MQSSRLDWYRQSQLKILENHSDLHALTVAEKSRHSIIVDLEINGKALTMEVYTGAAVHCNRGNS